MEVLIDGRRYVEARAHKIIRFQGHDVYYGDIVYHDTGGYNVAVSHMQMGTLRTFFVGQDGRKVDAAHAVLAVKRS